MRAFLWKLIHAGCMSRTPFNAELPAMNLSWWGRLLHIHIENRPALRRALLWIL